MNERILKNMNRHNISLSPYACFDEQAKRLVDEPKDIRSDFFRDIDRIIYSLSYTRYIDKTQVYSLSNNDNISRRMTHVQLVSKVARTIGRALALNEDLIEAAALGHDLGHVPFGHVGESILNKISLENNEGYFNHNIQSVRNLMVLENNGQGKNLTIQVLDAIMCHNGEVTKQKFKPKVKSSQQFLQEYSESYHNQLVVEHLIPMTLEGCVVRISDIIAYVGRDIEDATMMNLFQKEQLPSHITALVGSNNREIVHNFIMDVIKNSLDKDYIKMSLPFFKTLTELKKFNYQEIYLRANTPKQLKKYEKIFRLVFTKCCADIKNDNQTAQIYQVFLKGMHPSYRQNNSIARIVLDYMAGMTDDYLISEYQHYLRQ